MIKSLSKLFGGNVAVQVTAFALMPIVTRIYNQESLGVYQFIVAIALIASPFVTLSLNEAQIEERDDSLYSNLLGVCLCVSFLASCFFTVLLFFIGSLGFLEFHLLSGHYLSFFMLLFSSAALLMSKSNFVRSGGYGRFAVQSVSVSLAGNLLKILLGVAAPNSLSLLYGVIVGNLVGLCVVRGAKQSLLELSLLIKSGSKNILATVKAKVGYTLSQTLSQFISIFVGWHLVLFAPLLGSIEEVGLLALAIMTVKTPTYPFVASLYNYAFSECARLKGSEVSMYSLLLKLSMLGGVASILGVLILFTWGGTLYRFVFGEGWGGASVMATYLGIAVGSSFFFTPAYRTLANLYALQSRVFFFDVVTAGIVFIGCYIAYTDEWTLLSYVLFSSVCVALSHFLKCVLVVCLSRNIKL